MCFDTFHTRVGVKNQNAINKGVNLLAHGLFK